MALRYNYKNVASLALKCVACRINPITIDNGDKSVLDESRDRLFDLTEATCMRPYSANVERVFIRGFPRSGSNINFADAKIKIQAFFSECV